MVALLAVEFIVVEDKNFPLFQKSHVSVRAFYFTDRLTAEEIIYANQYTVNTVH